MRSTIVIETVKKSGILKGKVVVGENIEEHSFLLDTETGDYHVEEESKHVDWPFFMKMLLPNQKIKQS